MQKTFYSYSFGCRVNQAEKEALDRQLMNLGYEFDEQKPELYIINTCSVTHKAEREAKQMIYQVRKKHPETRIVVMGCAATNWIKTKTTVDGVDMMIDNQSKEYVASLIQKRLNNKDVLADQGLSSAEITHNAHKSFTYQDKFLGSKRVIIKIQDGCQRFCTYCIVPYLRGLPKSIPIQTIVDTINNLEGELQEVVLTAINTEAYGYDTKTENFNDLLKAVLEKTNSPRMSFGSIHPWSINDEFFQLYEEYKNSKRFVHFFHIPLQSGSNKMLGLMKRNYTREEFVEKLHKIADMNPFAFIGTDVIVGFLEENDKDFQDTYDFMANTPISKFHVFRYSERQHTAASYLGKRLSEPDVETKKKRAKALTDLGIRKYKQFLQKHIGHNFEALVLEKRDEEVQHGLLENQIPIKIKTSENFKGEIKNVQVEEYKNGSLIGKII